MKSKQIEVKKLSMKDISTSWRNLVRLVESAALLVVAIYAIYGAYHYKVSSWLADVLIVAGVIIGLRGAWELLRHLAEKDRVRLIG